MSRGDKAISVRQPHALAIVSGFKSCENRSRSTKFRGRVAIHASTSINNMSFNFLDDYFRIDEKMYESFTVDDTDHGKVFQYGAILGSVEIVDCVRDSDDLVIEDVNKYCVYGIDQEDFIQGPWCYLLANAQRYKQPIKVSGKVSIPFGLPDNIVTAITSAERNPQKDVLIPSKIKKSV